MKETILNWLHLLLDLFYPKLCAACSAHLTPTEELICIICESDLAVSHFFDYDSNPIEKLFWGRVQIKAAGSLFYFHKKSGIQNMMHLLKYKQRKDIGKWMGQKLGESLLKSGRFESVDVLIPVPLHWRRLWGRGFNQSELLCRQLRSSSAVISMATLDHRSVRRTRATQAQSSIRAAQRSANLKHAFTAIKRYDNLRVAIVDDVFTTGATAAELASTLRSAGADHVEVWCLARTPGPGH